MESKFFVLQVTNAILREVGSAVQRVYDENNQDLLNIQEAVVTLSVNLLSYISGADIVYVKSVN